MDLEEEHAIVIETFSKARFVSKEQVIEIFIRALIIYTKAKDKDIATYYISEAVTYIISIRDDISETELQTIADQVSKEGGELIMTLAERLMEKGRQEAMTLAEELMEKGRQEGLLAGKREMAKNFLKKGLSTELVSEASELPLEEILKLKKEIEN